MAREEHATVPDVPEHLRRPLAQLVGKLEERLGQNVVSVVLYGSAARDEHVPGRSDTNLLLVLKELGAEQLRAASRDVARARKQIRLSPVFLSISDLAGYADTFAIELLEMQEHHVVLYGEDLLAAVRINPDHLRLQLRHELRGKLFRLRQRYLRVATDPRLVAQLMANSIGSFLTLFAALLRVQGKAPATGRSELAVQVAREFRTDAELLRRLLAARSGERRIPKAEADVLFGRYLTMVESVIGCVDSTG